MARRARRARHELRAERGGKLNALRFAAGERRGEAVEREVVESDGVEEVQALLDLVQDASGDLFLHGRELEVHRRSGWRRRW